MIANFTFNTEELLTGKNNKTHSKIIIVNQYQSSDISEGKMKKIVSL
jgi:hypothetical protein